MDIVLYEVQFIEGEETGHRVSTSKAVTVSEQSILE